MKIQKPLPEDSYEYCPVLKEDCVYLYLREEVFFFDELYKTIIKRTKLSRFNSFNFIWSFEFPRVCICCIDGTFKPVWIKSEVRKFLKNRYKRRRRK